MRAISLAVLLGLAAAGSVAAAGVTVQQEMKTIVDPATNTIFAVGGDVDPANGPDAAKVPASRWAEALAAARKLKGPAASLLTPANKAKGEVWAKSATDFSRLVSEAEKAAAAKDGAAFSKAANDLGDTCTACHSKYKKQS